MGILDNKSRIVDAVLTLEGRRQLVSGKMKIESYSFTDADLFYDISAYTSSSAIGSLPVTDNASSRFYFEASPALPGDRITLEADDSGLLVFDGANLKINDGNTYYVSGSTIEILSGSAFASQISGVLASSIDNFKNLRLISTFDRLFGDEGFSISQNFDQIEIDKSKQFNPPFTKVKSIDATKMPDLVSDWRFSNSVNFKFLPPLKKLPDDTDPLTLTPDQYAQFALGTDWIDRSPANKVDWNTVRLGGIIDNQTSYNGTRNVELNGFSKEIKFTTSPQSTKTAIQIFEVGAKKTTKLDILDAGYLRTGDVNRPLVRVVFVGKVISDVNGTTKFGSIFTLLFD